MKFGQNGVKKNLFSSCLTPYLLLYLLPNNYTVCKLNMEIKGRIIHVLPLQEGVSKAGNPWKKQEYVLETFVDEEGNVPEVTLINVTLISRSLFTEH